MATGIQTGMRSRSIQPKTSEAKIETISRKFSQLLSKIPSKLKNVMLATVVALALVTCGLSYYSYQNRLVDLFPKSLSDSEVQDVASALTQLNIDHQLTLSKDGFLIPVPQKASALASLASLSVPRHPILRAEQVKSDMSRTTADRKALDQRVLEGEITQALRGINGILDATVKLAIPERHLIGKESTGVRASIVLTQSPEQQLNALTIQGIQKVVAFSVPELTPENVQVMNSEGKVLTKDITTSDSSSLAAAAENFELVNQVEKRKQSELQKTLDEIFPGRTKVVLSFEIDFSAQERKEKTPGFAGNDKPLVSGRQSIKESYEKNKEQESKDKAYSISKESVNYEVGQSYFASLIKAPRISGISATVFADNMSPKEAQELKRSVEAALGVQYERGDKVNINTTPWDHNEVIANNFYPSGLSNEEAQSHYPSPLVVLAFLLSGSTLLAGAVVLSSIAKKREQSLAADSLASAVKLATITDGLMQKDGQKLKKVEKTSFNTTELLEGVVSQKPAQVADLLRSTWLS